MAERRMFARAVTGGARFLRMPVTSRLLYYDLGMAADDDGCVEAFAVMRMTGATEDDLKVLVSKGFVRVLNEDLVVYITDWQANNQIRKDRYHEGRYKGLIDCEVGALPDNQVTTEWQPRVNQAGDDLATEVRLGKVSIGKASIGKASIGEASTGEVRAGEPAQSAKPPAHTVFSSFCSGDRGVLHGKGLFAGCGALCGLLCLHWLEGGEESHEGLAGGSPDLGEEGHPQAGAGELRLCSGPGGRPL